MRRRPTAYCEVEDSRVGVAAGVAAGMTVLGWCAVTSQQRLLDAGAHQTFSDMSRLPDLIAGNTRVFL